MKVSLEASLRYVRALTVKAVCKSPACFIRILEQIRPAPEPIQRKYEEIMLAIAKEIALLHLGSEEDRSLQEQIYYKVLRPLHRARTFLCPNVHAAMLRLQHIEPEQNFRHENPALDPTSFTRPAASSPDSR